MHITCPSCNTIFALAMTHLDHEAGREVQCSVCQHVWHATRASAVETIADRKAQASNRPRSRHSRGDKPRNMPRNMRVALWQKLGVLAIALAIVISSIAARNTISAMFPSTMVIYEALGLRVAPNISAIDFVDLTSVRRGNIVHVKGFVVNASIWPVHAPPIALSLHDATQAVLAAREIVLDKTIIAAGERVAITTQMRILVPIAADAQTEIVAIAVPRLPGRAQGAGG